jgi:DNA-binding transcriptional MerR regulator
MAQLVSIGGQEVSAAKSAGAPPTLAENGLRIGDIARATGKTARALRLYEELGLLTPGTRSAGGFRLYDAAAVDRVKWITQLQDLGFTLQDVQVLVQSAITHEVPREAMSEVRQRFGEKLDELTEQIERLSVLRSELLVALRYLEVCGVCPSEQLGPRACIQCGEHGSEHAPALIKGVTETASESSRSAHSLPRRER